MVPQFGHIAHFDPLSISSLPRCWLVPLDTGGARGTFAAPAAADALPLPGREEFKGGPSITHSSNFLKIDVIHDLRIKALSPLVDVGLSEVLYPKSRFVYIYWYIIFIDNIYLLIYIYIYTQPVSPSNNFPPIQPAAFVASGVARSRVARDRGGQVKRGKGVVVEISL